MVENLSTFQTGNVMIHALHHKEDGTFKCTLLSLVLSLRI